MTIRDDIRALGEQGKAKTLDPAQGRAPVRGGTALKKQPTATARIGTEEKLFVSADGAFAFRARVVVGV